MIKEIYMTESLHEAIKIHRKSIYDGSFNFDDLFLKNTMEKSSFLLLVWKMNVPQKMLKLPDYSCDETWLRKQASWIADEHLCSLDEILSALREWAWALEVMEVLMPGPAVSPEMLAAFTEPVTGMRLLPVPRGSFMMGAPRMDKGQYLVVNRQFPVTLSQNFWMSQTPVTQRQWQLIMGRNPSDHQDSRCPVENVSWFEAVEFCQRLTAKAQAAGTLPAGLVFRLPSEAEWEYVCRAGRSCRDSRVTDFNAVAWHGAIANQTMPVGLKAANPWGFHDMLGNVYEWCQDWFAMNPRTAQIDPCRLALHDTDIPFLYRVARGGCFDSSDTRFCQPCFRLGSEPDQGSEICGFRIVCGDAFVDESFYLRHLAPPEE